MTTQQNIGCTLALAQNQSTRTTTATPTIAEQIASWPEGLLGGTVADWFPFDVLAALSDPRNHDYELQRKGTGRLDRRIALLVPTDLPHVRYEVSGKHPIQAGATLIFESCGRTMRHGSLQLAVRLMDARLTVIEAEGEEYALQDGYGIGTRLLFTDCESGASIADHEFVCLGCLVHHCIPLRTPVEYGGCTKPQYTKIYGEEGHYQAVYLRDGSMMPIHETDAYVLYRTDVEPVAGDIVAALVEHVRPKPKLRPWHFRQLREWEETPEEILQHTSGYTVRKLEETPNGPRLVPLQEGFATWTEGHADTDGFVTRITVMGVTRDGFIWGRSGSILAGSLR